MATIGKEFNDNYPRRADGGWEGNDFHGMACKLTDAVIALERMSQPGYDPKAQHMATMNVESMAQELRNMLEERFVLKRDELKAEFIRHSESFDRDSASPFLSEE